MGSAAQLTAIDFAQSTAAICELATNPDLRRSQGQAAQARARSVFDWSVIVPQYQALWAEQTARRQAGPSAPPSASNPFRPDPFSLRAVVVDVIDKVNVIVIVRSFCFGQRQ